MPILLGPELAFWCELLAVLGLGTSVAVGLAALISQRVRSAVWERAVWQACTLTLLALVGLELTGLGAAAVRLGVASWKEVRSDREILESAFTQTLEDGSDIATQSRLMPADSALVAPARSWPAIIWGIGSLVILGRIAWSRALLAVFWWRCTPLSDVAIRSRVQSIANRLGLRREIRTLTSSSLRSPAVFHWLFPVLALPSQFSDDFSDAQQEAVLAHELAHLARRDPVWQSVAMLACAVLWWQPLSWWSSRRLRAASEAAADEASLLLAGGPSQLAASLVSLAQRLTDLRVAAVTGVQGNGLRSDLARRVERLLSLEAGAPKAPSKRKLALTHTALPVCLSMLCILCTAWVPSRHSFAQGETTVNVLSRSWRSSLAAAMVWTAMGGISRLPADEPLREETIQTRSENTRSNKRDAPRDEDGVREVLEAIRQQVEQLQKEGNREAAERLKQVAEAMTRKFTQRAVAQGVDRSDSVERKLKSIHEQAEKLAKEGKRQEAESLLQRADAIFRSFKDQGDPAGTDRSENVKRKLKAVREQAEKLAKEGKIEQAEKLRREAEAMARAVFEGQAQRAERSELVKQKLRAAREQVDRLRERGDHDSAEKLMREAEAMVRESQELAERAERSEVVKHKLSATRQQVDQLRKQGDHEAAEKLMRDAESMARTFQADAERAELSDVVKQKLRATRLQVDQLRMQGDHEAAEKLRRDAEATAHDLAARAERTERSEVLEQKLQAAGERMLREDQAMSVGRMKADQLRKQGEHEAAEKLMREVEEMARKRKEAVDSFRRDSASNRLDSADDLRSGLRQVQSDLKELREQLKKLQDQRSSNRK